MPETDAELLALRERLGTLDQRIVELIAERFRVIGDVAREKAASEAAIRDVERERQVLAAVEQVARTEGAPVNLVRRIYRDLLAESVSRQVASRSGIHHDVALRVAVRGEHSFGYLAAQKYLASRDVETELVVTRTYEAAVSALQNDEVDLAVLPIENTAAGSIDETYDLLRENEVSIVGEETSSVDYCLCGVSDVPLGAISQVLAAVDGLEQCSRFLQSLPNASQVLHFDTGAAMRLVHAAGDSTQVAIGAPEAAAAHGLVVLRRGIANHAENYTRFVVLARQPVPVELNAPCKTSLILIARHEHGALMRSLGVLAASGHSMTKLESRPRPGRPFEYMFFIDFEGNIADPRTADALDDLRSTALHLKILGSYPATTTSGDAQPGDTTPLVPEAAVDPLESVAPPRPATKSSKNYRLAGRGARPDDTVIRVGNLLIGGERIHRHGRPVLSGVGRADQRHCSGSSRSGRSDSARRCLQAAHLAVRLPGPRMGRAGAPRRGGPRHRDADHQRGHGGRPGPAHGGARRHPPGGDSQHAELRPAARARQGGSSDPPQARSVQHHRRMAGRRRVHPRHRQSTGDAL